jgi:DNA-binding MarR family transcriptional regulator
MLKATTCSKSRSKSRLPAATIELIQSNLQSVTRSLTQIRSHEHLLRAAGVRLDRAGIALLFKLHHQSDGPLRVTSLAELLGVDAPTVTRKVQQLERLGFVSREPDPDDGRATRIRLTKSGRETLDRVLVANRDQLARVFKEWSTDEVQTFAVMINKFSNGLRIEMESPRDE